MDKVYKKIEVVGTSTESFSHAVRTAIARGTQSVEGVTWFEVTELRGSVVNGAIGEYQVTVKLGFKVMD